MELNYKINKSNMNMERVRRQIERHENRDERRRENLNLIIVFLIGMVFGILIHPYLPI